MSPLPLDPETVETLYKHGVITANERRAQFGYPPLPSVAPPWWTRLLCFLGWHRLVTHSSPFRCACGEVNSEGWPPLPKGATYPPPPPREPVVPCAHGHYVYPTSQYLSGRSRAAASPRSGSTASARSAGGARAQLRAIPLSVFGVPADPLPSHEPVSTYHGGGGESGGGGASGSWESSSWDSGSSDCGSSGGGE